jgi:hypothetical protein
MSGDLAAITQKNQKTKVVKPPLPAITVSVVLSNNIWRIVIRAKDL